MADITKILSVVCIHGEGDQQTVNRLKDELNAVIAQDAAKARQRVDPKLTQPADEPADVTAVLRDDAHNTRVELHLTDWADVAALKAAVGYDAGRRHWVHGGKIRVTVSAAQ